MARGKQLDNQTVYNIMTSYFITNNFTETSRELDIPLKTVETIVKRNIDKKEFAELRRKNNDRFAEKATRLIDKALDKLEEQFDNDEKIPVNQLSTALGILYDKRALSRGEATQNTGVIMKFIDDID